MQSAQNSRGRERARQHDRLSHSTQKRDVATAVTSAYSPGVLSAIHSIPDLYTSLRQAQQSTSIVTSTQNKRASCTNPVVPVVNLKPTDRVAGKSPTGNPIRTSPSRILIGNCSPRTPQLGACHTTTRLASIAIPCFLLKLEPCLFLRTRQDLHDGFVCDQAACAANRQQTILRIER